MATSIPLPLDTPRASFRVTLDGSDYTVRLDYHERQDRYFLALDDASGAIIVAGVKLVANWSVLRGVVNANRPPGMLYVMPSTSDDGPGFNGLGRGFSLLYFDAAEVAEA